MRIIGGSQRGRRLVSPRGQAVRPTSDFVREALFDILHDVEGWRVLDLCAGTGAVGLEALSRGAARAVLVERARPALSALSRNAEALGYAPPVFEVRSTDLLRALPALGRRGERFELIFADPPYAEADALLPAVLAAAPELLSSGGRLVLEHGVEWSVDPAREVPPRLSFVRSRRYGETVLSFFEAEVEAEAKADAEERPA
jgi:16S rRNA (guanine(966)-N(2))-methyltransferase RsmD